MKNKQWYCMVFLLLLGACTAPKKEKTAKDLPLIGQHDIVYEAMDGYQVGDTIFHQVGPWAFIDQDSTMFHSASIDNQLWIANFFFSYCPTVCVPMNKEMKKVNEALSAYADQISFLSFSIDERRDTPTRLRAYKEKLDFNAANWHFFTGDQDEIIDMAIHDFQILADEDDSAPGGFLHSSSFVLVDKNKHIRGIYESQIPQQMEDIVKDVQLLLNDKDE